MGWPLPEGLVLLATTVDVTPATVIGLCTVDRARVHQVDDTRAPSSRLTPGEQLHGVRCIFRTLPRRTASWWSTAGAEG